MRWIRAAIGAGVTLLLAVMPASGNAAVTTVGSTLTAPANTIEAHQADTAFWQTSFPDGRPTVAPVTGQIRLVRIKGIALSDKVTGVGPVGGERDFHLQVARPLPDGTFQIRNPGGSSGNLTVPPKSSDPQGITNYSSDAPAGDRQVENLCVRAGDIVIFNTVGGWDGVPSIQRPYSYGTPLQIFSRVPDAVVSSYEAADKTNNGDILTPSPLRERELLMQVTIGSGPHATGLCAGGTAGPEGPLALGAPEPPAPAPAPGTAAPPAAPTARTQKATLPAGQRVTVSRKGKLSVSLFCLPGAARCLGTVRIQTRGSKARSLGTSRFDIASKSAGRATVYLNRMGRRLFKQGRGRLLVTIGAETRPGGASRRSSLVMRLRRR